MQDAPLPKDNDSPAKKVMRAIAVGLYILCPLPLIVLTDMGMDNLGVCGLLSIVAVATVLIILGSRKTREEIQEEREKASRSPLQKSVSAMVWALGLAIYCLVSFLTGAWYVTWVIFPILGALDRLLMVLVQEKEEKGGSFSFPSSEKPLRKKIKRLVWVIGIILFLIMSLRTQAWAVTWLVIPITAAAEQLIYAILDYREVLKNET